MYLIKLSTFLVVLGETEVGDFISFILDEYVGWLEIAVDHRVLMKVFVTADELLNDNDGFGLGQLFALLEYVLETALIAQLLEEIDVVGALLHVVQFHDIIILDGLHDLDLVLQRLVELLGVFLDVGCRDSLDCDEVAGADIGALIHLPVRSTADLLVDVDDEGLHELVVGGAQLGCLLLDLGDLTLVDLIRHSIIHTRCPLKITGVIRKSTILTTTTNTCT